MCLDTYINPAETGLYYLRSRYYSPELCRFISADTTEVLHEEPMKLTCKNIYAYCDNNPISKLDSNGRSAIAVLTAFVIKNTPRIIGAAVSVGAYVMSSAITKEKITWIGIGTSIISGASFNPFFSATIDAAYEGYVTITNNKSVGSYEVFNSAFLAFALSMLNLKDIPILRNIVDLENDIARNYMVDFCTALADSLTSDATKDYIENQTGHNDKNALYNDIIALTNDHLNLIRICDLQYGL